KRKENVFVGRKVRSRGKGRRTNPIAAPMERCGRKCSQVVNRSALSGDQSAGVSRLHRARGVGSRARSHALTSVFLALVSLLVVLAYAPAAGALISPVATIDGASSEIVELGDVAMA